MKTQNSKFERLRSTMNTIVLFILSAIIILQSLPYVNCGTSCANSACDANNPCTFGLCCNGVCTAYVASGEEGAACSCSTGCKPGLCCLGGTCSRDCYQTKGQIGCSCSTDGDCYSNFVCVNNQCMTKAGHMDKCVADAQCDGTHLKCLDDELTSTKRCLLGANTLSPESSNSTCLYNPYEICDPLDSNWTYCNYDNTPNMKCVPAKSVGDRCTSPSTKYPCINPWLSCSASKCTPFFSVPFGGRCDGPSQCQIPLVCNHTYYNYNVASNNQVGYCTLPFDGPTNCRDNSNCRWPLQTCACNGNEGTSCLAVQVEQVCQKKWEQLAQCGQQNRCYPPFYSAYGWIEWRPENSCIHEYCKTELLDFYCCYSCHTGTTFEGLTCDGPTPTYSTPNCCSGDLTCYDTFFATVAQQKQVCQWQRSSFNITVPPAPVDPAAPLPEETEPIAAPSSGPIATPTSGVTDTSGSDYSYLVTTIAVALALAIGATFFGLFYWRKKREYETITGFHDDTSVNMQQLGVSVGN